VGCFLLCLLFLFHVFCFLFICEALELNSDIDRLLRMYNNPDAAESLHLFDPNDRNETVAVEDQSSCK